MKLTSEHLKALVPHTPKAKRDRFLPFLNEALPRYGITTELRVAAFLGTILPESDWLKATLEYASGKAYEGRRDLGNTRPGDGIKFAGRGLIQTTGRYNYQKITDSLGKQRKVDFIANPELLEELYWAVESACFFWQTHKLNALADKRAFFQIQGIVNRGQAGKMPLAWPERKACYERALRVLPDDFNLGGIVSDDVAPDDTDTDYLVPGGPVITDEPAGEPAGEPADEPASKPASEPAGEPAGEPTDNPAQAETDITPKPPDAALPASTGSPIDTLDPEETKVVVSKVARKGMTRVIGPLTMLWAALGSGKWWAWALVVIVALLFAVLIWDKWAWLKANLGKIIHFIT